MFFFLEFQYSNNSEFAIQNLANQNEVNSTNTLYINQGVQNQKTFFFSSNQLILLGDPVAGNFNNIEKECLNSKGNVEERLLYEKVKGHYYWFLIQENELSIGTSFGSLFPVYFHQDANRILVSSSSLYLAKKTNASQNDKRNLLERLLFNYPFFNSTWWEEIKLLAAHRNLSISKRGTSVKGNFEIVDFFGNPDASKKQTLENLSELFQREFSFFFPNEKFGISLTGGFDGRTIVASARNLDKEFLTFCYGHPNSSDLLYSKSISKKLNFSHLPITLDDNYVKNESLAAAFSMMELSEYNGNFGRPHYEFEARFLSNKINYILTGNFGSELFRALHSPGSMMSENLIKVFSSKDDSWKDALIESTNAYSKDYFSKEIKSLVADLDIYLEKMKGWNLNHKFYYFVYNELFRKYFGAELVMQSHYLKNRTPFLNLTLVRELNQTMWSGVHSHLFEKNLLHRKKGQIFYAKFLNRYDKKLYALNTNKGYAPADVLEYWRLPKLLAGVVYSKFFKKEESDPYSSNAFFVMHHKALFNQIQLNDGNSFLNKMMNQSLDEISKKKNLSKWKRYYSIMMGLEKTKNLVSVNS